MNPEVKQKWVAALRSGEYEQGQTALLRNGRYCCLGVLCDIYSKETGKASWEAKSYIDEISFGNQTIFPPKKVYEWAELTMDTKLAYQAYLHGLAKLNDGLRLSFNQIADLIEEQL